MHVCTLTEKSSCSHQTPREIWDVPLVQDPQPTAQKKLSKCVCQTKRQSERLAVQDLLYLDILALGLPQEERLWVSFTQPWAWATAVPVLGLAAVPL